MKEVFNFIEGEVLLIDKPKDWTSFDVVNFLRKAIRRYHHDYTHRIKVGHAGTLDLLATGLLIICTGKMTKIIDEYQAKYKEYTGTLLLGASTPSFDLETEVDKTYPTEHINKTLLKEKKKQFLGVIEQFPPIFSAVKIDGTRAYHFARKGQNVKTKIRKVEIKEFELTRIAVPEIEFRIACSKGTYIRSIVSDYGKALQSGAFMTDLRRTKIGEFSVENAVSPHQMIDIIIESERKIKEYLEN